MAKRDFRSNEYGQYSFSLYSKVWPVVKPPYQWNSFRVWCPSDEDAYFLEGLLCDGFPVEDEEYFAIANHARFGVRRLVYQPTEQDYQLPSGFSPKDMKWVSLNLICKDSEGWDKGGVPLTIPGVLDVEELKERLHYGLEHMLVRCWDGVMRRPTDIHIGQVETYKV